MKYSYNELQNEMHKLETKHYETLIVTKCFLLRLPLVHGFCILTQYPSQRNNN